MFVFLKHTFVIQIIGYSPKVQIVKFLRRSGSVVRTPMCAAYIYHCACAEGKGGRKERSRVAGVYAVYAPCKERQSERTWVSSVLYVHIEFVYLYGLRLCVYLEEL